MSSSAAIADSRLRQAWPRRSLRPGGWARRSGGQRTVSSTLPFLAAPRARLARDCAISPRTVIN